jgi:hypothetical protein
MKQPKSNAEPSKDQNAKESGTDSEKLKMKRVEHVAGVLKASLATGGKIADWGKQATATKAALRESDAKIRAAEEKTKQVAIKATTEMDKTQMLREKNADEHFQEMAKLQIDYERMKTQDQERKRVLDKLLDEPVSPDQLAQSFLALIPPPKH